MTNLSQYVTHARSALSSAFSPFLLFLLHFYHLLFIHKKHSLRSDSFQRTTGSDIGSPPFANPSAFSSGSFLSYFPPDFSSLTVPGSLIFINQGMQNEKKAR